MTEGGIKPGVKRMGVLKKKKEEKKWGRREGGSQEVRRYILGK